MTNKPYISCALEAALAAKNHGFKFIDKETCSEEREYIITYELILEGGDFHRPLNKYYIAEESLPLLEPLNDDWGVINTLVDYERCDTVEIYVCAKYDLNVRGNFQIIWRNGLPFPKVQYEES